MTPSSGLLFADVNWYIFWPVFIVAFVFLVWSSWPRTRKPTVVEVGVDGQRLRVLLGTGDTLVIDATKKRELQGTSAKNLEQAHILPPFWVFIGDKKLDVRRCLKDVNDPGSGVTLDQNKGT